MARLRRRWRVVKWAGVAFSLSVLVVFAVSARWSCVFSNVTRSIVPNGTDVCWSCFGLSNGMVGWICRHTMWRGNINLAAIRSFQGLKLGRERTLFDERIVWRPSWGRLPNAVGYDSYVLLPLWVPLLMGTVPTGLLFWLDRRRIPAYCCQRCGYDLTGNVSGSCPECGLETQPDKRRDREATGKPRFRAYLVTEALFASAAALSFIAAYSFWVELETRPAIPNSEMPLWGPAISCAAFFYGLITLLQQDHDRPPLSPAVRNSLVVGLLGLLSAAMFPADLWR